MSNEYAIARTKKTHKDSTLPQSHKASTMSATTQRKLKSKSPVKRVAHATKPKPPPCRKSVATKANTNSRVKPKTKKDSKRKIRFDTVEIIELPIGLGDNPCVRGGPPISCTWNPQFRLCANLDHFETMRLPLRRGCRRLCHRLRTALVEKHGGFSQVEIDEATINAKKAKLERFFSTMCPSWSLKNERDSNTRS